MMSKVKNPKPFDQFFTIKIKNNFNDCPTIFIQSTLNESINFDVFVENSRRNWPVLYTDTEHLHVVNNIEAVCWNVVLSSNNVERIYKKHINTIGGHIYSYILSNNSSEPATILTLPLISKSYIDTVLITGCEGFHTIVEFFFIC